jgi:GntR family transcriptional regulator
LYRVVLLRFANRVPVVLERGFFPCSRCPRLEEWDLEKTPIIDLLTRVYGVRPRRVSQTVEAVAANETVARQLRVEEGFPLLMLNRILYDPQMEKPVWLSQDFLRSDYARIHTEIDLDEFKPERREKQASEEFGDPSLPVAAEVQKWRSA